jgi:hypothetical protein
VTGSSNSVSSIYLFWASLGAGKTHALYYLISSMKGQEHRLPIYSEYPESPTGFVDIYSRLAQNVDWDWVADLCFQVFLSDSDPLAAACLAQIRLLQPDTYRAFFLVAEGESRTKARLARRWFRGEQLTRTELRDAALSKNLDSTGDCAAVISVLAKLLGLKRQITSPHANPFRLVWVIDECQRLQGSPPRLIQEVNAGLQSTFNSTPDYLTIILSFTGKPDARHPKWLRPELADRIGVRNLILLPPFSMEQARNFSLELIGYYRSGDSAPSPFFPFTEKAIQLVLQRLRKPELGALGLGELVEKDGIRPRAIIKYLHAILQEHMDQSAALPIDDSFIGRVIPR